MLGLFLLLEHSLFEKSSFFIEIVGFLDLNITRLSLVLVVGVYVWYEAGYDRRKSEIVSKEPFAPDLFPALRALFFPKNLM